MRYCHGLKLAMLLLFSTSLVYAAETKQTFVRAMKAAKAGQVDFAFMQYRSLLRDQKISLYQDKAIFANGEYYFLNSDYQQASHFFTRYLNESQDKNGRLFAYFYLLQIAQMDKKNQLAKNLERDIKEFNPHAFVFRSTKEYKYISPLSRKHRAVYTIAKVEFYVDNRLVCQISY